MKEKLEQLKKSSTDLLNKIKNNQELEELRVSLLGKKGEITSILKGLKELNEAEKKEIGLLANNLKNDISEIIENKRMEIEKIEIEKNINENKDFFDYSFPGFSFDKGSLSPISIVQREIEEIFTGMGFRVVSGPEVESEYYNFEALNVPKNHPARDTQDTYWLDNGMLLRSQTSPCQIRAMHEFGAPVRVIAPGRCFRSERIDASHENTFFQLEGMMIDENISIANLIYIMKLLISEVFKKDIKIRLRPGFFPFVEPAFELDLNCMICGGEGCPTCKHSGWVELVPCGMIHPNVLRHGGIDPDKYSGFAFGLGLTRLAMMKYGIKDIRMFNSGDLRAYRQFPIR